MADFQWSLVECKHVKKRLESYKHDKEKKTRQILWETWSFIWNLTKQIMKWSPFVNLSFECAGVCNPTMNDFCYNTRTAQGIKIKLRFVQHFFLRNIISSKSHPSIWSTHAQMSHIETWSGFADQLLDIIKRLRWFSG